MMFWVSMFLRLLKGASGRRDLKCDFCRDGPRKQGAIAQTRLAYLKPAGNPGEYLIVARRHWVTPDQLPVTWWWHVQWLLLKTPGARLDNTAQNWTPEGGATQAHVHLWAIMDRSDEEGLLSHRLGFATILRRIKERMILAA
jgi:hypothetical protein